METNQTIQNAGVSNAEIVGMLRQIKTDIDELKATPARSLWDVPLWNVKQLAEATGWAKQTIYGKVANGDIPYYKPQGKMLFFVPDEIREYITASKVRSNAQIKEFVQSNY